SVVKALKTSSKTGGAEYAKMPDTWNRLKQNVIRRIPSELVTGSSTQGEQKEQKYVVFHKWLREFVISDSVVGITSELARDMATGGADNLHEQKLGM
ncbi:hypothetical protein HDU96_005403, partial [Phlyctochytrium bullatum]